MGKVLRLYGIGRVFESRGDIITFYLFLFTLFFKLFFIVQYYLPLIQLISVIIRIMLTV